MGNQPTINLSLSRSCSCCCCTHDCLVSPQHRNETSPAAPTPPHPFPATRSTFWLPSLLAPKSLTPEPRRRLRAAGRQRYNVPCIPSTGIGSTDGSDKHGMTLSPRAAGGSPAAATPRHAPLHARARTRGSGGRGIIPWHRARRVRGRLAAVDPLRGAQRQERLRRTVIVVLFARRRRRGISSNSSACRKHVGRRLARRRLPPRAAHPRPSRRVVLRVGLRD